MNSAKTTKQRPYASKSPISRICRLLLVLGAVKLSLLAALVFTPAEESPLALLDAVTAPKAEKAPAGRASSPDRTMLAALESSREQSWPENPVQNEAQNQAQEQAPRPAPQASATPASAAPAVESARGNSRPGRSGVAYAAEALAPPPPNIAPMASPTSPERIMRPDEAAPSTPPAPSVAPLPSRDSALEKQAELNRREQELLNLQQQMEARVKELNTLENRVQGMLKDANQEQDGKMQHLVDTYANMKPRQAAQVLATLDERIAVRILSGLKSKQAGEIFSYMDPARAAVLSELLSKMQLQ